MQHLKKQFQTQNKPRNDWEESFRKMHLMGDDNLIDSNVASTEWDEFNWTWEDINANSNPNDK